MSKRIMALLLALGMAFSPTALSLAYAEGTENAVIAEEAAPGTEENETAEGSTKSQPKVQEIVDVEEADGSDDILAAENMIIDEPEDAVNAQEETDENSDRDADDQITINPVQTVVKTDKTNNSVTNQESDEPSDNNEVSDPENSGNNEGDQQTVLFEMTVSEVSVKAKDDVYLDLKNTDGEKIESVGGYQDTLISAEKSEDGCSVLVSGLKIGKTDLVVTGTEGSSCTVHVTVTAPQNTLKVNETNVSVTAGLVRQVLFSNSGEQLISLQSSNEKVATVMLDYDEEDGCYDGDNTIVITGRRPGTAVITLKGECGTVKTVKVTVDSFMNTGSLTLEVGEYAYIYLPELEDEYNYNYIDVFGYSVKSANSKIATAYIGSNFIDWDLEGEGLWIRGAYPGKTTINVYGINDSVCPVTVTVNAPPFTLSTSTLKVTQVKNTVVTAKGSCIKSVTSSDTGILTVKKTAKQKLEIAPVKAGKATVTVENYYGTKKKITVTVDKAYFKSLLTSKTTVNKLNYAVRNITGKSVPGASVSTKIGQNTYKATVNSKGNYSVRIPIRKVGEAITLTFKYKGQTITKTIKVQRGNSRVWLPNWTYKNSTKVVVKASTVHKGDKIKLVVGKKTYYYNITKDASSISATIKINKPNTYGVKMRAYLMNKYNQPLVYADDYVYHSGTVHMNDSKAKVKWLVGWNDPEQIDTYSTGEYWYYDWQGDDGIYDAYLYFNSQGKVKDWWIQQ